MKSSAWIAEVTREWEIDTGFFWRLRQGHFSEADFERALAVVAAIPSFSEELVPRRLVSLLWFIPLFMRWQLDLIRNQGGDEAAYRTATDKMTTEIERILGLP